MKKILSVILLIIFIQCHSQLQRLKGEWILDKIVKANSESLEINNPRYSMSTFYNINSNELSINDFKFKATFSRDQIKLENRTFNYWFEEDYLLLKEGDEVSLLLKPEAFIKRYPEFKPEIEIRGNDTLLVANKVIHPVFNHEKTFDDFIIPLMTQEASKDMDDLYFKISYILTKNNRISNIQILDKRTPQYDSQFIQALKKAEKYFQNPYGKDMLVTKENHFLKFYQDLKDKSEKDLYNIISEGLKYYNNNNFEKAIEEFSMLDALQIKENRFKMRFQDAYIKLGISYLAVGKNDQACVSFKKAGGLTDFEVRNYLINFCK